MEKWKKEMRDGAEKLGADGEARAARFAQDLVQGLEKVKEYPLGVTIFGSARFPENSKYYDIARNLGAELAKNGHTVITGGGPGVMEAANRGAFESGGRSVGLNIHLSTEQDLNPYVNENMEFNYFFARKVMLTMSAKIYVFFPGGFGTMDEFSEILELKHTGKIPDAPIFLVGKEFWRGLDAWFGAKMSEWKLIETGARGEISEIAPENRPADFAIVEKARDLYQMTDDISAIVAAANRLEPGDAQEKLHEVWRRADKKATHREGKYL